MHLVDTSVWVEVFREGGHGLRQRLEEDTIVTCLPVIQEVLQGFREERSFRVAREAMLAMPVLESPLTEGAFLEAAELYRGARRAGITIRSSVDCLIAACAIRHDVMVLHKDRDYDALARISSLRSESLS